MANLVSPGYSRSALIGQLLNATEERVIEFKGLNRKPVREDGEMYDMVNLTSDNYPVLTPRKPRDTYDLPDGVTIPLHISTRYNKIALIAKDDEENINFYFDGEKVDEFEGLVLTENSQMVSINTKICFFPQKTYLEVVATGNTVSINNFGYLEEKVTITSGNAVTVTISNEDARITLSDSYNFAYDDALNIIGTLSYTDSQSAPQSKECNVSCIVEAVITSANPATTTLVLPRETFIELTGEGATAITFYGKISRTMPDLDMVLEWNNRLWGASSKDNTIYACKLGDPKNWQYYQGTGLDSYYAQQGTDGMWTGCAPYSSHILFFKQDSITKIYGSAPSNFQVQNVQAFGVEEGSSRSIAVINDQVFYKSIIGIMVYDGGIPYCISENFNALFLNVVAGSDGKKYYANVQNEAGGRSLMVFDIDKGLWHKEGAQDGSAYFLRDTCTVLNKMYFITHDSEPIACGEDVVTSHWLLCGHGSATSGTVYIVNPENYGENYKDLQWRAVFGPFDEYIENRKIYSKLLLRLIRDAESEVKVYISINEGAWELVQSFAPASTGGDYIPIIPRRCDRYSIKIEGKGNCSIKSLTRKVRAGTGGRL